MDKPKRLKDWVGLKVRNTRALETQGGRIFPAGTVFEARGVWRGLKLETVQPCECGCLTFQRHEITTVRPESLEIIGSEDSTIADPFYVYDDGHGAIIVGPSGDPCSCRMNLARAENQCRSMNAGIRKHYFGK